ncbi:MAG: cobalt-precorrin-5B (C(1))-methyltransferase CbiD [Thermodesulfobacteriota bacterium]
MAGLEDGAGQPARSPQVDDPSVRSASLRSGYTTGTCAAAAAKHAVSLLCGQTPQDHHDRTRQKPRREVGTPDRESTVDSQKEPIFHQFFEGDPGDDPFSKPPWPHAATTKHESHRPTSRKPATWSEPPDVSEVFGRGSGGQPFFKRVSPGRLSDKGFAPEDSLVSWVEVPLPNRGRVSLRVEWGELLDGAARAAVRKDAGDDPDVTDRALVVATVVWADGEEVLFAAGEGVGVVTKPGLSIPPGEPAINPVPRRMIRDAVREITQRGVLVEISIPGGKELAARTFNPRLGIEGGLSILGTSGIVRPFSTPALRDALKCALDVAIACGVRDPVLVPGRIGEKAARRHFRFEDHRLIEVGNEWGFLLDLVGKADFDRLLLVGHPGKLAKLAAGQWDTHSSRSESAAPWIRLIAMHRLSLTVPESPTVEGILAGLPRPDRDRLAVLIASTVREAVWDRITRRFPVTVVLVDMRGDILATDGDSIPWQ